MKTRYEKFMEDQEFFNERITKMVELKQKLNGENYYRGYINKIEYNTNTIEVVYYEPAHCSCCSGDEHWYEFKVEELFMDLEEYEKQIVKEIEEREEKKKKAEEEKKRKEAEEKEKKDRELYEKLKKQYENE